MTWLESYTLVAKLTQGWGIYLYYKEEERSSHFKVSKAYSVRKGRSGSFYGRSKLNILSNETPWQPSWSITYNMERTLSENKIPVNNIAQQL